MLSSKEKESASVLEIPVAQISPNKMQPRRIFDENELISLSNSISINGILQPLIVKRLNYNEYELIAGERRLRAAMQCGLKKVPCVLFKCTDMDSAIFALIENLQRSDLVMFEEAKGISRLMKKFGLTQEQAAIQLGKTQSTIANKLRILKLSVEEQDRITEAGLTERHARALLKIQDEKKRKEILEEMIEGKLNVAQSEILIAIRLLELPYEEQQILIKSNLTERHGKALLKIENEELRKEILSEIAEKHFNVEQTDILIAERLNELSKENVSKPQPHRDVKGSASDLRFFINSINKALDVLLHKIRLSGVEAITNKKETDQYIEYTVKVSKDTMLDKRNAS